MKAKAEGSWGKAPHLVSSCQLKGSNEFPPLRLLGGLPAVERLVFLSSTVRRIVYCMIPMEHLARGSIRQESICSIVRILVRASFSPHPNP